MKHFFHFLIVSFFSLKLCAQELFLPEYIVVAQKTHIAVEWTYWCGGTDISHFVVERSKDGINTDSLAIYPLICLANGELAHYSFADSTPHSGFSYYRIKAYSHIYDSYYYENWKNVIFQGEQNIFFQANPNPVEDEINLIWYKPTAGIVQAVLYDKTGKIVQELVNENFAPGTKVLNVKENITSLPQGLYFLRVMIGDKFFQNSLLKK